MSKLTFNSQHFTLEQYETVLDCLLRNGQAIPYACKAGMCQACLIRAVDCEATAESKKWIKPELQQKGFTLACQWVPQSDVQAELPGVEDFSIAASIIELAPLNGHVMRMRLQADDPARMFASRPGQYLTLINPDGITRSYSIANDQQLDGFVELHISRTSHGVFSGWVFSKAASGEKVHMRGASGDCYYDAAECDGQPLLLAGTGSGLAPLYGILRDALGQGHQAPVWLFHGGRDESHLYYRQELQALAGEFANFSYIPCCRDTNGSVQDVMESTFGDALPARACAFLCGAPDFVHGMRKRLFLKGLRSANIHCDPFTERTVVATGKTEQTNE